MCALAVRFHIRGVGLPATDGKLVFKSPTRFLHASRKNGEGLEKKKRRPNAHHRIGLAWFEDSRSTKACIVLKDEENVEVREHAGFPRFKGARPTGRRTREAWVLTLMALAASTRPLPRPPRSHSLAMHEQTGMNTYGNERDGGWGVGKPRSVGGPRDGCVCVGCWFCPHIAPNHTLLAIPCITDMGSVCGWSPARCLPVALRL